MLLNHAKVICTERETFFGQFYRHWLIYYPLFVYLNKKINKKMNKKQKKTGSMQQHRYMYIFFFFIIHSLLRKIHPSCIFSILAHIYPLFFQLNDLIVIIKAHLYPKKKLYLLLFRQNKKKKNKNHNILNEILLMKKN